MRHVWDGKLAVARGEVTHNSAFTAFFLDSASQDHAAIDSPSQFKQYRSRPQPSLSDLKLRIDWSLHRGDKMVRLTRQSDNRNQLGVLRLCHAARPGRRRM